MKKFILTIALFAILGLANSSDVFPFDITEVDTSQNPEGWAEFFTELEKVVNESYNAEEEEDDKEKEEEKEKEEVIESEEEFVTEEDDAVLREKAMKSDEEESSEGDEKSVDNEDTTKQEEKKPSNDPVDQNNDKDEEKLLAEELCLPHICPHMYVPICASIDGEKRSHPSPCEFRNEVKCKAIINERMGKALPTVQVHYGGSCKN